MMNQAATVLFGILLGQSVSAQTEILCTTTEQWTFAEEVSRPASWAFNVIVDGEGKQLSHFNVGGLACKSVTEVYVNDENIGFKCSREAFGEPAEYSTRISRLRGDFIILREYARSSQSDGVTIGFCQQGSRRF